MKTYCTGHVCVKRNKCLRWLEKPRDLKEMEKASFIRPPTRIEPPYYEKCEFMIERNT